MIRDTLKHLIQLALPHLWEWKYYRPILSLSPSELHQKGWEPELFYLSRLLIKEGGLFIDVGANIGQYSYVAREVLGPQAVYAFEPLEETALVIFSKRGPFHQAQWVHWSNLALSNQKSEINIHLPKISGDWKVSQAAFDSQRFDQECIPYQTKNIRTIPLDYHFDTLFNQQIPLIQMIKIDVEGAESLVLDGMKNILFYQSPIIQIEIEERHNKEYYKIFGFLMDFGYQFCYQVDREAFQFQAIPYPNSLEGCVSNNFYFSKKPIN